MIVLKQLFTSGSVIIGKYLPVITSPSAKNSKIQQGRCKYYMQVKTPNTGNAVFLTEKGVSNSCLETTSSRQFKELQNETNSENRHLVFLIFKKKQENDGVGDISSI